MRVVTWNVLHRIHAENWREAVPDRFPVEAERLARIAERVATLLEDDGDDVVVGLQEVSGDQLRALRARLPRHAVLSFRYPRVPSLRASGPCPLVDPGEYLVTIAVRARAVAATAWANDPGKGALVVDVDGLRVINTHLSGRERGEAQLTDLAALAGDDVVVMGDFNAGRDAVLAGLDPAFIAAPLADDALPTRPRPGRPSEKPPAIDHILVRGAPTVGRADVVDVDGESDHNLVRAVVSR